MSNTPDTMKAMQLTGHGDLDRLVLRNDVFLPEPGPKDVLIEVGASAVNNTDVNTRRAWYSRSGGDSNDASWSGKPIQFPRIQGADVCGRVVAAGDQVEKGLINKRVLVEPLIREAGGEVLETPWYFGSECDGGFAQYTVVAARHAYPVDSNYTDVELASFPCSYSTALNMLHRANVRAGETVLITGASGGVGSAAIQLASVRGANIIAITSPSKTEELINLGAQRTLTRNENIIEALDKNSVDVVIDLVAGESWPDLLVVLKPFGRYAVAGAIGGPLVELDVRNLYLKDLSLFGCTILAESIFPELVQLIEAGEIKPVVAGSFTLSEIPEAQKQFELKRHVGKLVVDLSRDSAST